MAFVPTNRAEIEAWLKRYHETIDSRDASRLSTVYNKDAKITFGNMPEFQGVDALRDFFEPTWAHVSLMVHEIDSFDMVGNTIYEQYHITSQVKGDPENEKFVVPAFGVYRLVTEGEGKGLASGAQFYMDTSPLMAAIGRTTA